MTANCLYPVRLAGFEWGSCQRSVSRSASGHTDGASRWAYGRPGAGTLLNPYHRRFAKQASAVANYGEGHRSAIGSAMAGDQAKLVNAVGDAKGTRSGNGFARPEADVQRRLRWIGLGSIAMALRVDQVDPCAVGALRDPAGSAGDAEVHQVPITGARDRTERHDLMVAAIME